jgi:hypothetical protein
VFASFCCVYGLTQDARERYSAGYQTTLKPTVPCSVIMCTHAVNITLPWTLGVYMVRDYMGISQGPHTTAVVDNWAPSQTEDPSVILNTTSPQSAAGEPDPTARLPEEHVTAAEAPGPGITNAQVASKLPEDADIISNNEHAKFEHLVGVRAGILSAAFSFSQVCASFCPTVPQCRFVTMISAGPLPTDHSSNFTE